MSKKSIKIKEIANPIKKQAKHGVWAVDPYEKELIPDKTSLEIIRKYLGGSLKNVIPVYIQVGGLKEELDDVKLDMQEYLSEISRERFSQSEVLRIPNLLITEPVRKLLSYARKRSAQVIVVSSHGRKGIERLLFGSFAEKLLEESKIPVLFLTHHRMKQKLSGKTLFATDFSKHSKKSFIEFLKFTKNSSKKMILYNLMRDPFIILAASGSGGGPMYYPEATIEEQKRWVIRRSNEWIELANKMGIQAEITLFVEETFSSVAPSILNVAEENNIELIGLSSSSSPFEKAIFGSVAKEIFRKQLCPTFVCGPKFKGSLK